MGVTTIGIIFVITGLILTIKHQFFAIKLFKRRVRRNFNISQRIQGFFSISLIIGILCFFGGGFSIYRFFVVRDFIGLGGGIVVWMLSIIWLIIGIKTWSKISASSYQEEFTRRLVNWAYPIFYLILGVCILLAGGLSFRLVITQELPGVDIFRLMGITFTLGFIIGIIFIFLGCQSIIKRFDFYHYLLIQQQRVPNRFLQIPFLILGIGVTLLGIFLIIKGL